MGLKVFLAICFFCLCEIALAQDTFDNLRHVGHSTTLLFLRKDGHCDSGTVVEVSSLSVTIGLSQAQRTTIPRSDLLRVGETDLPHDSIYSARSSWQDVTEVSPGHAEVIHVVTKNGKSYRGKPTRTSADVIVLKGLGGSNTILKRDVARVEYFRQRPTTDSEQYVGQEAPFLLVFDPNTWIRASALSPKMTVTLYDSSLPEDNAPMKCLHNSDAPVK